MFLQHRQHGLTFLLTWGLVLVRLKPKTTKVPAMLDHVFVSVSDLVSSVEIKPATDGRNDPASESCIRCDEKRGIFLLNKPDTNELRRGFFVEKKRLFLILGGGGLLSLLAGF